MTTSQSPTPRPRTPLDEEIQNARHTVNDLKRRHNILHGIIFTWILVDVALWTLYAISKNVGVGGAAMIVIIGGGLMLMITGAEGELYQRSSLISTQTNLKRLELQRKEALAQGAEPHNRVHMRYREAMPELIEHLRIGANRNRRINHGIQTYIIVGSLSLSSLIGATSDAASWAKWTAIATTLSLAIFSSVGSYYNFKERGKQLQVTADSIEREFRALMLGIGKYDTLGTEEGLRLFIEVIEEIRATHASRQVDLDHPAEVRFVDESSQNP